MKRRLANAKTRKETGFDYVVAGVNVLTPFGQKRIKETPPFFPGEEGLLKAEFGKLDKALAFVKSDPKSTDALSRILMEIKDVSGTITRAAKDPLSVVELFEIKSLLLKMDAMADLFSRAPFAMPEDFVPVAPKALLRRLDPRNDKMDAFYLYDEFSEALTAARKRKRETENTIRAARKKQKEIIAQRHGLALTPKFERVISKANAEELQQARAIPELVSVDEDYTSVTFAIKDTEDIDRLRAEADAAAAIIEEEELAVREVLSGEIAQHEKALLESCARIGAWDVAAAKAAYALAHRCVIPEIAAEHALAITKGRHLQVEDALRAKDTAYCPVDLTLAAGVTCLTGANMGGKTVSLKLIGLISLLTQNAFFVPCEKAAVGLSAHIQLLIGDDQSLDRGLSGFGSEMETLRDMLDNSGDRSLLLIDEMASDTNPAEGSALTKAVMAYLKGKPYISVLTTHFDVCGEEEVTGGMKNMQVVGLAGVDFDKLNKELRYAGKRERIQIIAKHMDYRLREAAACEEVPRDALNIAKMLGIDGAIIENAKKYL